MRILNFRLLPFQLEGSEQENEVKEEQKSISIHIENSACFGCINCAALKFTHAGYAP